MTIKKNSEMSQKYTYIKSKKLKSHIRGPQVKKFRKQTRVGIENIKNGIFEHFKVKNSPKNTQKQKSQTIKKVISGDLKRKCSEDEL